jgi:hypothetical protein
MRVDHDITPVCVTHGFLVRGKVSPMPRDGSMTLSDVEAPFLQIICAPCERQGRFAVAQLMAQHGDAKLTDLLQALVQCEKAQSLSIHDRCKAVYLMT